MKRPVKAKKKVNFEGEARCIATTSITYRLYWKQELVS